MFTAIVVGTDGSDTAGQAVRQAIDLAQFVGATLHVVSAYEPVPRSRLREEAQQAPTDVQWTINPREDVDATLARGRRARRAGRVTAEVHARQGDPADSILDVAEEAHADLARRREQGDDRGQALLRWARCRTRSATTCPAACSSCGRPSGARGHADGGGDVEQPPPRSRGRARAGPGRAPSRRAAAGPRAATGAPPACGPRGARPRPRCNVRRRHRRPPQPGRPLLVARHEEGAVARAAESSPGGRCAPASASAWQRTSSVRGASAPPPGATRSTPGP